jgi:rare lipoprotein A
MRTLVEVFICASAFSLAFMISSCAGGYGSTGSSSEYELEGIASYYAEDFHGRRTSSGERYDMYALTAAHRQLPFNSIVRVTNLENDRSVEVRINDRGPFKDGRVIDLSFKAALELGLISKGTVPVRIEIVELGSPKTR